MITLASDFGSPYPAAMRGVVRRTTDAELVDIAHDLPRGDPRAGAFWLRFVLPEFPPAVHCAVVDPGVGTDRAAIAVRAGDHVLVAPDNGLALPPARALATATGDGPDDVDVFEIVVEDPASATFHGRDVFAPAAARIREAVDPLPATIDELRNAPELTPTDSHVDLELPEATIEAGAGSVAESDERATTGDDERATTGDDERTTTGDDERTTAGTDERTTASGREGSATAIGEVLVVDDFGNVITNVPGSFLADADRVRVNGETVPAGETFAAVAPGERLVTVGSHGYVECDVNDGRGDEAFGLSPGDHVRLVR